MAARKTSGPGGKGRAGVRFRALAGAALVVVAALWGLWLYFGGPGDRPIRADPRDADLVSLGVAVYEANCAVCHGANLEGQPNWRIRGADGVLPAPPHDETGHTWHHPDGQLFGIIKEGGQPGMPPGFKSGMPAYRDVLTDRQIIAVLAYIKSRWPDTIRRRQDAITRQSR